MIAIKNARIWQWSDAALAGPSAMLAAAARGEAHAPFADWMTFDGSTGAILALGTGALPAEPAPSQVHDLGGRLVLPGLHDAHIHMYMVGATSVQVSLAGCESVEAMVEAVSSHAAKHPELSWVVGIGWDQSRWGRYPSRHDLDGIEALAGRPCFLWRACWHIGVGNSEALRRAGVEGGARVEGGSVETDDAGAPTGVLRERAADGVHALLGEARPEVRRGFLTEAVWQCAAAGLTCVHTHEYGERWCAREAWGCYVALQRAGELPLRVELAASHDEEGRPPPQRAAPLLRVSRGKIFGDGSLGAETAALRTAYVTPAVAAAEAAAAGAAAAAAAAAATGPEAAEAAARAAEAAAAVERAREEAGAPRFGQMIFSAEEMRRRVAAAAAEGYQLEVHAIGDACAEVVLDAFASELPADGSARPILTHCQVLGDDLIARMAALGVVANVQPSFVPTDAHWVSARLAAPLRRTSYAWRSLLRAGVWVAGGSDAPVELPRPLLGIFDAMARAARPEGGGPADREAAPERQRVLLPEERLPFAAALWLYTVGGARAARREADLGALARGFLADFVVLPDDVSADPTGAALLRAEVDETWVGGQRRYGRATAAAAAAARPPELADPRGAGRNGPARQPVAVGAAGCPCCAPWKFRANLEKARAMIVCAPVRSPSLA